MKVLLSFASVFWLALGCKAASPSFSSFYPNHFTTNGLVIKANLNPSQFDTNASVITITITNVAGVGGLLWTNSLGSIQIVPTETYDYIAPSNTLLRGWYSSSPRIALLNLGTNVIDATTQASHLLFSTTNDAAQVILSLTDGPATDGNPAGPFLEIMSYTNTVWNGRFTLPHGSSVSGGGLVRLNNGQDWIGANGAVLTLKWVAPDWWETGRWTANATNSPGTIIINPTVNYIPVKSGAESFADSPLHTSAPGSTNTLIDGNLLYPNNNVQSIGAPSGNQPEIIYSHRFLGGSGFSGVSAPTFSFDPFNTVGIYKPFDTALGHQVGFVITGPLTVGTFSGGNEFGWPGLRLPNNGSITWSTSTDASVSGAQMVIDSPVANRIRLFFSTNVLDSTGVIFGPGVTNVLSRDGTALVYSNPYTTVSQTPLVAFKHGTTNRYVFLSDHPVSGGNGLNIYGENGINNVTFGTKSDGNDAHITADTGGAVWLSPNQAGSGSYAFVSTGFAPDTDGKNIGTITNPWGDRSMTGSDSIYGHRSGAGYTNYSRLVASHTGTNGFANFNTEAANDAGPPRPINFQIGGTNMMRIDSTATAGETRFWLYDEDNGTMERVSVGAPGSGGVGFKLLRIPD